MRNDIVRAVERLDALLEEMEARPALSEEDMNRLIDLEHDLFDANLEYAIYPGDPLHTRCLMASGRVMYLHRVFTGDVD